MFCDRCGAAVAPDQRFCGNCGKDLPALQFSQPSSNRVREHVRLLGILWLAGAALGALGGLVLVVLANTLFVHLPQITNPQHQGISWLHPFLTFLGILVLLKSAAGFLAGWGLLNREPWARVLTLVLAFLALFQVPLGTALGIYTLWVLLPAAADADYEAEVRHTIRTAA
jgi:hypothetical protein